MDVRSKLDTLVKGFLPVLYQEDDPDYEAHRTDNKELYRYWEWPQGVGLFGLWKLFEKTGDKEYLAMLESYYDQRLAAGLPGKNVNTMAPVLALVYLAGHTRREDYLRVAEEWVGWLYGGGLPRTDEGGWQHRTTDDVNEQELWDDTLMMSVMPMAALGRLEGKREYLEEAEYQLLLHIEHLADPVTGFWYHGYTFKEKSHFSGAFWGRGNAWATVVMPLLVDEIRPSEGVRRYVSAVMTRQAEALLRVQDESGLFHTLLDKEDSYLESSCTCGFGYGILKGISLGLLDSKYKIIAERALPAVLSLISEDGIVAKCSAGTPMGRVSQDFYREIPVHPMPYGQALAIMFLMEAM